MFAIIPARGGSKGLPGKNIKKLNGIPLIAYTIEAAKKSNYISKIIVSTDDREIAKIAIKYGAEVPFMRPDHLSSDTAKAIDNYRYSIPKYEEFYNVTIDSFIVLQPTSPLRTSDDIDKAIELFKGNDAKSVISVSEAVHPPIWAKRITSDSRLQNYFDVLSSIDNRQEIPKAFMPNGAVYIFKYMDLILEDNYYNDSTFAYKMPQINSIDIDTQLDFELAELILNKRYNNGKE